MLSARILQVALRTPLGDDVAQVAGKILTGERAVRANARFDASSYECQVAASLPPPGPSRHRRFLRPIGLHALELVGQMGIQGDERLGLFFGYGGLRPAWDESKPALYRQTREALGAWARGLGELHPFWMLQHLSNNAHALAAEAIGARGDGVTVAGATAGAQALEAAIAALHEGAVERALVVAHDSLVEPECLVELAARGAATRTGSGLPYRDDSDGFVPGEAVAAILLGREGHGAELGAASLAHDDPATAFALLSERLGGELVDGAGTAQPPIDTAERAVIGARPLACTTAATGQLGAVTPLVQAIMAAHFLAAGRWPTLAGPRPHHARSALCLSHGAPALYAAVRIST